MALGNEMLGCLAGCWILVAIGGWRLGGQGLAGSWLGVGLAGDSVWSLAIQLVDWLAVQEGMVQCQGIGAAGEWFLV